MTTKDKTAAKSEAVRLRLPEGLVNIIDMHSRDQRGDRSSSMRLWLYRQAEDYVLGLVSEGRLSRGKAVELLGITYYEFYDLVEAKGIEIGPTEEQEEAAYELMSNIKLTPQAHQGQ